MGTALTGVGGAGGWGAIAAACAVLGQTAARLIPHQQGFGVACFPWSSGAAIKGKK